MANTFIIDGNILINTGDEIRVPLSKTITLPELTGSAAATGSVFFYQQFIPGNGSWVQVITGSADANNQGLVRYLVWTNNSSGSVQCDVSMSISASATGLIGITKAGDVGMTPGKPVGLYAMAGISGSKLTIRVPYI